MGLSKLNFVKPTVTTSGGNLSVRGLSLNDMMTLISVYQPAMTTLFARVTGDSEAMAGNFQTHGQLLLLTAPDLAATIIVMGSADDGDDINDPMLLTLARGMPAPDQLVVLEAIAKATFATEGGLKKAMETVIRVAREMQSTVGSLRAPDGEAVAKT